MRMDSPFSDATLDAFVDGELDASDRRQIECGMERDETLRARVRERRALKAAIRAAYADLRPAPGRAPAPASRRRPAPWVGLAAAASLLVGFLGGYLIQGSATYGKVVSLAGVAGDSRKLLLHVSHNDARRFEQVLADIERLYARYAGEDVQIDVVANAGGLDLLRADLSPFGARIGAMMRRYPGLEFVACTNAISRVEERGADVVLIPHTIDEVTAIDRIVQRLSGGWTYVQI